MAVEDNTYLNQVVAEQAAVEQELKPQQAGGLPAALGRRLGKGVVAFAAGRRGIPEDADELEEGPATPPTVNYRVTGFWLWKTVIVPPNFYVVHTRRGHAEPLHVGLGLSFRYNPYRDAFLAVPAAVQTLLINARCISAERQGVLVQAYVQWIVDDIRRAYRKLDFSDAQDPMRIVNVQLREQAEAAIKDKVATMPIDDILSDKQPIIEELTHRLRAVAEGSREDDSGLGLKIVTVQIKEAVVSSTRLWENLQKPFRAEREKQARLAELAAEQEVARRELENRRDRESGAVEHNRLMARLEAEREREAYDREQGEQARRHQVEQEAEQRAVGERAATERARQEADLELTLHKLELESRRIARELEAVRREMELDQVNAERHRQQTAAETERENLAHQGRHEREERDLALFRQRRAAENDLSEAHVRAQLIERLPEIAGCLPKPDELRAVSIGGEAGNGAGPLMGFLAGILQLARDAWPGSGSADGTPTG